MPENKDLQRALDALYKKKSTYDRYWRYYDGDQPLVYNSEKLREIFSGLNAKFTENWCAVVIDSVLDRMELRTPVVTNDEPATLQLDTIWEDTGLVDDEYNIHEDVAVTGEAFVIAWPDPESGEPQAFWNDARLCHMEYESENPKHKRFAAKWWLDDDTGKIRLTLYYPDRLEYYVSSGKIKAGEQMRAQTFVPFGDEPVADNPFGIVPVFHFRSNRRQPKSQLKNVLEVQDAINKLLADMMVASEFGAFKQRWVISQNGISKLKNSPNEIWDLPAGETGMQPTSVGQFDETDLNNFLNAINKLSSDIGIISRTPRHYFYAQGGDPSGEALVAMEAPLNRKVMRLQQTLAPVWRDLAQFLLLMGDIDVNASDIWTAYEPVETVQPLTQAQIWKTKREAGMPLRTVLREDGYTAEDLEELDRDMEAERVAERSFADAVLTAAQRDFDRGEVR